MPSIAEALAMRKKGAAAQPGAAAPAVKKPQGSGLTITPEKPKGIEPMEEILPRSLSSTSGEDVPRRPLSENPAEVVWHSALESLNTELCVIADPDPRNERAWLAIRRQEDPDRPIYLFSLPSFPAIGPTTEPF